MSRVIAPVPLKPLGVLCCRTAYTNTDRIYQATFLVTDGSTPALEYGNWYARRIRLPPLWQYQVQTPLTM
jgi:hypothetical protein